ncbi:MAG: peptidoglycan bridge formation glycyltransferase FemA/FemB family protein [Pseudomonadota bacterium]
MDDQLSRRPGDAWDRYLHDIRPDIGFMQSSWWAAFLADRGWDNFGIVFRDGDDIVGGGRVLTRFFADDACYFYMPEGPVLPDDAADARQIFEATIAHIERRRAQDPHRVSHLRLEPRWHHRPDFVRGFRAAGSWLDPRHTLHIDLAPTPSDILAQMKPKGRYNIGLARRRGVDIVEDMSPKGRTDFLDIYQDTMSRHGLSGKREGYLRDLLDILDRANSGTLLFAEYEGERVATLMMVYFGDRATYFFGGSLSIHRHCMAPYLLHFEAMSMARSRGHRWYDFYGIAPPDQPQHRLADISTFKNKFGGHPQSFVPALDLIFDAAAYEEYRGRKSQRRKTPMTDRSR